MTTTAFNFAATNQSLLGFDTITQIPKSSSQSYAFEQVYANLLPFQLPPDAASPSHPLHPIMKSNGLVFPYNPSISEGVAINYDKLDLTHTNEGYYAYRNTENVKISISDAVWSCDTFDNALYALSVLHFFRSYSFMDFGRGRSGRPPSPMWFSAYGNYAFNRVPVYIENASWSFPSDIDYVGIPEAGSDAFNAKALETNRSATGTFTWLPVIFTVASISLIVQHSPRYWVNFNLDDYQSGAMLKGGKTFHDTNLSPAGSNSTLGN